MNKLILNFFGEEVTIDAPKTLDNLRQQISNKFGFSPSDASEILVSYFSELKKEFIKTEKDFLDFVKKNIYKVDLDISPDSKLYQKSALQLKEETEKNKNELEELIKKKEELKKKKSELTEERKKEKKELENKIKELLKQKRKLVKQTHSDKIKIISEIKDTNQKIIDLQKKLGLPIINEKEGEKPETSPKQKNKKQKTKKIVKQKKVKKEKKVKKPEKDLFTKVNEIINKTVKKITKIVSEQLNKQTKEVEVEKKKIEDSKIQLKEKEIKGFFDFTSISQNISEEINKWTQYVVQQANELTNTLSEKYKNCMNDINLMKKKVEDIKLRAPAPKRTNNKKIHTGFACDGCGANPIVGNRFKCAVCPNFDYCEECEEKNKDSHLHPFIKIYSPEIAPLDVKCELK